MKLKSVLYFGSYDGNYSRNRIIKKGLIANGFNVVDNQASGRLPIRYFKLAIRFFKCQNKISAIIVGFPGHYDVLLAFILGKLFGKKVFYDIFASTYETYVMDRELIKKNSLRAKFFYFIDWVSIKIADYVIVDTIAHGKFYSQFYGSNLQKQIVVYIGSDTDYFYPRKAREETDVLFYGSYQPLQGVDMIIKAASKLPKVKFKLIGEGQTRRSAESQAKSLKLKNVEFADWFPMEKLAEEISKAKICLGIFGTTQKASVVIPNKVYDYLASAKPVITSKTDASKELFKNGENAILIPAGNYSTLAIAINNLTRDSKKRQELSAIGYAYFKDALEAKSAVNYLISELMSI